MKMIIFGLMVCLLTLVSCDKTDEQTTVKNDIKIKVYSTKTWNATSHGMDSIVGATVQIISGSETVTALTDNRGIATFSNVKDKEYCVLASKGELSNLINKSTLNNKIVGYLIVGVYNTQTSIEQWATYSGAAIGGPKLADINCDGLINHNDITGGSYIDFNYQYKDLNNDGILDANDQVNGNLILTDHLVENNVYIGN